MKKQTCESGEAQNARRKDKEKGKREKNKKQKKKQNRTEQTHYFNFKPNRRSYSNWYKLVGQTSASLLRVSFKRFWKGMVNNQTDNGLVNAHAKGSGGDDDLELALLPFVLYHLLIVSALSLA